MFFFANLKDVMLFFRSSTYVQGQNDAQHPLLSIYPTWLEHKNKSEGLSGKPKTLKGDKTSSALHGFSVRGLIRAWSALLQERVQRLVAVAMRTQVYSQTISGGKPTYFRGFLQKQSAQGLWVLWHCFHWSLRQNGGKGVITPFKA